VAPGATPATPGAGTPLGPRPLSTRQKEPVLRQQRPLAITDDEPQPATKTSRKILVALAQVGRPMSAAQIGLFTGLAHKGGAFAKALTDLRALSLIEGGASRIELTPHGRAELGEYAPLPEGHALFEFWCGKLGTTSEKILRALRKANHSMSSAALGEATGLSHTGGSFSAALTSLRKMDLIEGGGSGMRLSADLLRAIEPTVRVFDTTSGKTTRIDATKGTAR